jgi:prevent-host-death family protein
MEAKMYVALTDAEKQLSDLIRRVQDGEEVILTQAGKSDVRLVLVEQESESQKAMRAAIKRVRENARSRPYLGESAAQSQDFLYGWDGLPK